MYFGGLKHNNCPLGGWPQDFEQLLELMELPGGYRPTARRTLGFEHLPLASSGKARPSKLVESFHYVAWSVIYGSSLWRRGPVAPSPASIRVSSGKL